jgi:hypothetical protein
MTILPLVLPPHEGRTRRHERWKRDAMDALMSRDERHRCVRRRRVVLAPLGWCQVSWRTSREATVTKRSWTPGRARNKPPNIAQGMSMFRLHLRRLHSCASYTCTRGCGCSETPGIPCALCFKGSVHMTRAPSRRGNAGACSSAVMPREGGASRIHRHLA